MGNLGCGERNGVGNRVMSHSVLKIKLHIHDYKVKFETSSTQCPTLDYLTRTKVVVELLVVVFIPRK